MDREIVIKMPEEIYNVLVKTGKYGFYRFDAKKAIICGTPLPKGHGRLIDADTLETTITNDFHGKLTEAGAKLFVDFMSYVDDTPTIIEAEKGAEK